eukprot:TRINITY_DN2892_c0_g1_i1.p1 TRINITY_DN2892_c0_g1~~TRINITY_DN2892_c0_g1_i1.p1  ORF type:complete len:1004 (+),score=309.18 TRINITY_DN2892_c0_g1_i1:38-3013(+)
MSNERKFKKNFPNEKELPKIYHASKLKNAKGKGLIMVSSSSFYFFGKHLLKKTKFSFPLQDIKEISADREKSILTIKLAEIIHDFEANEVEILQNKIMLIKDQKMSQLLLLNKETTNENLINENKSPRKEENGNKTPRKEENENNQHLKIESQVDDQEPNNNNNTNNTNTIDKKSSTLSTEMNLSSTNLIETNNEPKSVDIVKSERAHNLIKVGWLNIDVIQAKNLSAYDSNGTSDPYCKINILTDEKDKTNKDNIKRIKVDKTKIVHKSLNPLWEETFYTIVDEHFKSLEIEMFDNDLVGTDDFMGRVLIEPNLGEISYVLEDWISLVPSPNHKSKKPPAGQIKLHVQFKQAREFRTNYSHGKHVEATSLVYVMKDRIMAFNFQTKQFIESIPFSNIERMSTPSVTPRLVLVETKKEPYNITCSSPEEAIALLREISKYSGLSSGYDESVSIDEFMTENNSRKRDIGCLKVNIFKALDLDANDMGGTSDPYCKISLLSVARHEKSKHKDGLVRSQTNKTEAIHKTVNPVWDQTFNYNIYKEFQGFEIRVYDKENLGKDKFLGRIIVDITPDKNIKVEKKEFKLENKNSSKKKKEVKGTIELDYEYFRSEEIKCTIKFSLDKKSSGCFYPTENKLIFYTNTNERVIDLDYEELLSINYTTNKNRIKLITGNGKTFIFDSFLSDNDFDLLVQKIKTRHPHVEKVDEISDSVLVSTIGEKGDLKKSSVGRKESVQVDYLSESYIQDNFGSEGMLTIKMKEGIGLAPRNKSGLSDPYAIVYLLDSKGDKVMSSSKQTKYIKNNLNPKWNEDMVITNVKPDYTGILVQVWDHEDNISKDNFMGESIISSTIFREKKDIMGLVLGLVPGHEQTKQKFTLNKELKETRVRVEGKIVMDIRFENRFSEEDLLVKCNQITGKEYTKASNPFYARHNEQRISLICTNNSIIFQPVKISEEGLMEGEGEHTEIPWELVSSIFEPLGSQKDDKKKINQNHLD